MKRKSTKREALGEFFRSQITSGKYVFGQKLPPVMKLCEELDGNYLTVLTVLHDLEDEGFIECRNGVGCFVRYLPADRAAFCKKVQMIIRQDTYEANQDDVLNVAEMGRKFFEASGWEFVLCPVELSSHRLQRIINNPDAFSVIYGFQPYLGGMDANLDYVRRRVVIIGEFADEKEIATIISDEHKMMNDAVDHLFRQGYRNPALVLCSLKSPVEKIFLEGWKDACIRHGKKIEWFNNMLMPLQLELQENLAQLDERAVGNLLNRLITHDRLTGIDSFICPGDYWSVRFGRHLQQLGYRIPEDYGLVSVASPESPKDFSPEITYIDNNLEKHIKMAVELLNMRYNGKSEIGTIFCAPPKLVAKQSTKRKSCAPPRRR